MEMGIDGKKDEIGNKIVNGMCKGWRKDKWKG